MATNGVEKAERPRPYLFDPESPEYIKDLQRPAVIKEDMSEMERRKRVKEILESRTFLDQLEGIMKFGVSLSSNDPDNNDMMQRLTDLTLPSGAISLANLHSAKGSVIPVADIKSEEMSKQEKYSRNKLASLFRLVDLFQWSQGIHNQITLRLPGDQQQLLVNPFGLLYHEITASSLVKVNMDGEVVEAGSTKLGVNQKSLILHAAIHEARPDINCVLHMHTAVVAAVASMKCGLLPLCQEAMVIGEVGYHEYQGYIDDDEQKSRLVDSLGDKNVILLRNQGFAVCGQSVEHCLQLAFNTVVACETQVLIFRGEGFVVVGESIEEVSLMTKYLIAACDHQLRAARAGLENIIVPSEEAVRRAYNSARNGVTQRSRSPSREEGDIHWKIGELEWEAWMRVLDHAGFRTGYIYRQPHLRPKSQLSKSMYVSSDVAIPPSTSASGQVDESDPDAVLAHKLAMMRRDQEKIRWLNSPNAYQRIEILETGTDCPKKITKWIQDPTSLSANGTPVKIVSPHQFSPMSSNPKEFKDKQKKIKEYRYAGNTSAGPQSQILDGVTYEDLSHIRPDVDGIVSQTDRTVLIGTASKGIIDRQHQHNAQVYRQLYAPNPFACETDEDIKKYIHEVEQKSPTSRTTSTSAYALTQETYDDDCGADTTSLMQGICQHRNSMRTSASMDGLDMQTDVSLVIPFNVESTRSTTLDISLADTRSAFDECDFPPPQATSTPKGKSTVPRIELSTTDMSACESGNTSTRSTNIASEDETSHSGEKKKSRRGLLSFLKKKSKKSSDTQ